MMLLVSDANILIDFEDGGLIEALFQLQVELVVPDILWEDELSDQHGSLLDLGLGVRELSPAGVQRVVDLGQTYHRTSRYDLAALALAEQESCPLLTGDGALRAAAANEGVEVHGTVWLVEGLVLTGIIDAGQAHAAYEQMREAGSHLPWEVALPRLASLGTDLAEDQQWP